MIFDLRLPRLPSQERHSMFPSRPHFWVSGGPTLSAQESLEQGTRQNNYFLVTGVLWLPFPRNPWGSGKCWCLPPRPQSLGPSGALAGLNPRCLICNCVNNILRWDIIAHTQKVGVTNILLPGGLMDCLLWSTRARVVPFCN